MPLLDIRKRFCQLSGRMDLGAPPDHTVDNGADWFIANGVRFLDRQQETMEEAKEWQESFAVGDYEIKLLGHRSLKEVWFTDSDGEKVELRKKDFEYLMDNYPKLGSTTNGTPAFWAYAPVRRANPQQAVGPQATETPLYIMPPTDTAITVHCYGVFASWPLLKNTDVNFWSEVHPDVLVLAALMSLEGFYRNTQGVADYANQIQLLLFGIDKDVADAALPENENLIMRG